jgi:hypothetical protein
MISALFVYNHKGELVISRTYRDDMDTSVSTPSLPCQTPCSCAFPATSGAEHAMYASSAHTTTKLWRPSAPTRSERSHAHTCSGAVVTLGGALACVVLFASHDRNKKMHTRAFEWPVWDSLGKRGWHCGVRAALNAYCPCLPGAAFSCSMRACDIKLSRSGCMR